MNGTHVADFTTVTLDTCSLARVQGRMLARHKGEGVQGTGKTEHRFYISLDVEEIDNITTLSPTFRQTAAANHTRQHRLLLETFKLADQVIILGPGVVAAQGSPEEVRNSSDPLVHQFVHALPQGPVPFHYQGPSIDEDFGGKSVQKGGR